jgi:uncharacterized LabA/DUF88 family protein
MSQPKNNDLSLAVLIDADNVTSTAINEMMEEISKYGKPTFKRIYGDFTSTRLNGWKDVLNEHAITPMQQYSYTAGKNATDSALIIDAMDMLHTADVGGFFIVSSDSDFTKLATRLREGGKQVFGMGEKKTPKPFINACEKFIYLEVLRQSAPQPATSGKSAATTKVDPISKLDPETVKLIVSTVEDLGDDAGWVQMGRLGGGILKKRSDFDPRNFGYTKLTDLIAKMTELKLESREKGDGNRNFYVRVREKRPLTGE